MKVKKLKKCRNCFNIFSNHKYVIASGDGVTVYRREDLSVQCTIPSKIFPHAYCFRFLSDDVVMMKNNYAHYMVYDIVQGTVLWKFNVRSYDSVDRNYLVSSDGKTVFDLVFPSDLEGPVMELIVSPMEKCYMLQPLQEPILCQAGWVRYPRIHVAKDAADGIYVAFTFGPPKPDSTQIERGFVLQHKNRFAGSDYEQIKQWDCTEPFPDLTPSGIKYLDSEYVIFDHLQYWSLITKQYGKLPDILYADIGGISVARKSDPVRGSSFFLLHELYFLNGIEPRQRIFLIALPDCQLIETFDHVDGTEDTRICDVELLDSPDSFLIGTMSGIYLCER